MNARLLATFLVVSAVLMVMPGDSSARQRFPTLAPFAAVQWVGDEADVQVGDAWYRLVAIDGIEAAKIVEYCKKNFRDRWQKRFEEDLVQVLDGLGHKAGATVTLKVRDPATGAEKTVERVPMTEANRRALWTARNLAEAADRGRPQPKAVVRRARRDHAAEAKPEYAFLQKRVDGDRSADLGPVAREQAEADLDELEWHLANRYAYARLRGVDYLAALDAIRAGLGNSIPRGAFAIQIAKLLALFGDGHTRVIDSPLPGGHLPFLVGEAGGRLVAFQTNRTGFVDDAHPHLNDIDGVAAEKWLEAAARIGPGGSPQYARRNAIENLRYIGYLRRELGLPAGDTLRVGLESTDGKTRVAELPVVRDRPLYGAWPRGTHRRLDGDIGYLRVATMSDRPNDVNDLVKALNGFRDTRGLIIDVRGNGGGSRVVLDFLFPPFMRPDDPPRVVNVAAYRIAEGERADEREGYLADRSLFPLAAKVWSPVDRESLKRFAAGFKPEWPPPGGEFSDWHYFALKPVAGGKAYESPIVVLMDSGCFSATDIFLGAFKGWRNVTLMGTPSGGGSGRARRLTLQNSGIGLQLSSMASFQPDGRLYDGRGVTPDVELAPTPTDLIGRSDSVLDAAVKRLAGSR